MIASDGGCVRRVAKMEDMTVTAIIPLGVRYCAEPQGFTFVVFRS